MNSPQRLESFAGVLRRVADANGEWKPEDLQEIAKILELRVKDPPPPPVPPPVPAKRKTAYLWVFIFENFVTLCVLLFCAIRTAETVSGKELPQLTREVAITIHAGFWVFLYEFLTFPLRMLRSVMTWR